MEPEVRVPVTTVPNPRSVNERSSGSRNCPVLSWPRACAPIFARCIFNSSIPWRVIELTGTTGAPWRNDPRTNSSASSLTSPRISASTRSALVSTTSPLSMPNSRQMSKCSRVCGLMDSSAPMTSRTRSMPPEPASMLRTKRSCPGTSMKPMRSPGSSRCAKPRSMEMPRRFSSARRSVSMPVSARTNSVLP